MLRKSNIKPKKSQQKTSKRKMPTESEKKKKSRGKYAEEKKPGQNG